MKLIYNYILLFVLIIFYFIFVRSPINTSIENLKIKNRQIKKNNQIPVEQLVKKYQNILDSVQNVNKLNLNRAAKMTNLRNIETEFNKLCKRHNIKLVKFEPWLKTFYERRDKNKTSNTNRLTVYVEMECKIGNFITLLEKLKTFKYLNGIAQYCNISPNINKEHYVDIKLSINFLMIG